MINRFFLLLVLSVMLAAGCTSAPARSIPPMSFTDRSVDEFMSQRRLHIGTVMDAVERRNHDVEKNPFWISWAYSGLNIRKLQDIPAGTYGEYARYLDDNKSVYIIVHPSYYLFFHSKKPQTVSPSPDSNDSIVDIFLNESPQNAMMQLEQEQQKNEKNFMEYLTMDEKLVILLLPRNYRTAHNYTYKNTDDEYARYLNEIANGSPSVIYMESESSSVGRLLSEDLIQLLSFLEAVGAKSVLIGGGYVGRCQKEFYNYVTKYSFGSNYFIVPEISTFSPEDVPETSAMNFLENNRINIQAGSEFVVSKTPSNTNLQHLPQQYINTVINISERNTESSAADKAVKPPEDPARETETKGAGNSDDINYCY